MKVFLVYEGDGYTSDVLGVLGSEEEAHRLMSEVEKEHGVSVEIRMQEWEVGEVCGPMRPDSWKSVV